ncbi:GNAT family N-acetyltransferase [Chryseobacterium phosphatilyticum]|uniref:GNAT family N-acetyltransferase n=1 Tax=Chryseobacterium phosphatilyticum TaxID=475075 RepID=A0A316XI39_9FLAO|nr:GNAT family N-acetyltransferase [Chryseobacterium phosphatilyticum]PWN71098.1 GNAT family N-acetyltransferase [Chryseobacterium phosphatilyticum]
MKKENVSIHGKNYTLYIGYQNDEKLRSEFNRLTQEVWNFDFENYYQSGFWDNTCQLYSLFDGERIVSHTTVSLFIGNFEGKTKKLIQLGTVMTDEAYQKQGLSRFLMERIMTDFKGKHDGMFLFANETVLDFYPKFGFNPVSEFEAFQHLKNLNISEKYEKRKLDLDQQKDLKLFEKLVENAASNTLFPVKSKALTFFYCYANPEMGYKDSVYYIEELNCIVITEVDHLRLRILEIFSPGKVNVNQIISAFTDIPFEEVILGFTPEQSGFEYRKWQNDDLYLFVTSELQEIFEQQILIIPILSHT